MTDIKQLIAGTKRIQEEMVKLQEDLATQVVEADSGGGMVVVKMNGNQEILDIEIEDHLLSPRNKRMLIDLLVAATNTASTKTKAVYQQAVSTLALKYNIPDAFRPTE